MIVCRLSQWKQVSLRAAHSLRPHAFLPQDSKSARMSSFTDVVTGALLLLLLLVAVVVVGLEEVLEAVASGSR